MWQTSGGWGRIADADTVEAMLCYADTVKAMLCYADTLDLVRSQFFHWFEMVKVRWRRKRRRSRSSGSEMEKEVKEEEKRWCVRAKRLSYNGSIQIKGEKGN
ncbi:hypothetical protein U1Q18_012132 [Sarracenia purpurea var. burkii]